MHPRGRTTPPLASASHLAARKCRCKCASPPDAAIGECVGILHERPPDDRERRGRAPVHRTEAQPVLRELERWHDVPSAIPAIEKRPHDDGPIAIQRTSSWLPDARSRCLYASTSMCWLLSTRDGMNTRSSPVDGSRMIRFPRGAGSM